MRRRHLSSALHVLNVTFILCRNVFRSSLWTNGAFPFNSLPSLSTPSLPFAFITYILHCINLYAHWLNEEWEVRSMLLQCKERGRSSSVDFTPNHHPRLHFNCAISKCTGFLRDLCSQVQKSSNPLVLLKILKDQYPKTRLLGSIDQMSVARNK